MQCKNCGNSRLFYDRKGVRICGYCGKIHKLKDIEKQSPDGKFIPIEEFIRNLKQTNQVSNL